MSVPIARTETVRAASIGECMVEFHRRPDGSYGRGFGGDTLNCALYLARLGIPTDYVTLLGDDRLSQEMVEGWEAEGIGTGLVGRLPGRLPGLYLIETDARGERTFLYWRSAAPARDLIRLRAGELADDLAGHTLVYLSGVTLSLFDAEGRSRLIGLLGELRGRGVKVAFDDNYRPRGWPELEEARAAFTSALRETDIALPSFDDEVALFGDVSPEATIERMGAAGVSEIVLKRGDRPCLVAAGGTIREVPAPLRVEPVDTTAAGDSFNAGYLAARLRGAAPPDAAVSGHRLAAAVVSHRGAIIPRSAMPGAFWGSAQPSEKTISW
ncbi:MAG: sugar kinase [Geminicoccaceae bacterium]